MMKKLFITFSTVAILTCSSVNASEKFDINPIHIEITDDLSDYDENDGQFVEIKHLVSEGSFENWLAKTAKCAIIVGSTVSLVIAWKSLMIAKIKILSALSACYVMMEMLRNFE